MNIRNLANYRNRELVGDLKDMLRMAESGEISAVAVVVKFGPHDHRAGMLGTYKKNPSEALQATFILESKLRGDMLPVFGGSL